MINVDSIVNKPAICLPFYDVTILKNKRNICLLIVPSCIFHGFGGTIAELSVKNEPHYCEKHVFMMPQSCSSSFLRV